MKTLRFVCFALAAMLVVPQAYAAPVGKDHRVRAFQTKADMLAYTPTQSTGQLAVVLSSDQSYVWEGSRWKPLDPQTVEFYVAFNEGASKGLSLWAEAAMAAYSTTADALNYLRYGPDDVQFEFVGNILAAGTFTPVAAAGGLDIHGAAIGNGDEFTLTRGRLPGTGRPIIPGSTKAGKACITYLDSDVSTNAAHCLILSSAASPQAPADLSSSDPNYTSYAAICNVLGDVKVSDSTTGATDTTANWADDETHEHCLAWSSAGVVNYYIDDVLCGSGAGTACPTTDPFTLADGSPYLLRFQGLGGTSPDDVVITEYRVDLD